MPYNTTPLPPRQEPTGTTLLPLSRVKKIVAMDQDIAICSNNAAFVLTVAAEMFVQHLASAGLDAVKMDHKPRKNIQYKDIANAVSTNDKLEFLQDIVPKTVTYRSVKESAAAMRARLNGEGADEKPVNGKKQKKIVNGGTWFGKAGPGGDDDPEAQLQMEARQAAGDDDVYMT